MSRQSPVRPNTGRGSCESQIKEAIADFNKNYNQSNVEMTPRTTGMSDLNWFIFPIDFDQLYDTDAFKAMIAGHLDPGVKFNLRLFKERKANNTGIRAFIDVDRESTMHPVETKSFPTGKLLFFLFLLLGLAYMKRDLFYNLLE